MDTSIGMFFFTFIDLFAGIGGMRLAFESAGGRCVYSNEWNKYSQQTYFANFGEQPEGDITKVDENSIPDHDVLVAGFPCQPFSIAGVSKKNSFGRETGGHQSGILVSKSARFMLFTERELKENYILKKICAYQMVRYGNKIQNGFSSVDDFIVMANQVLNRRKSRSMQELISQYISVFR